MIRKALLSPTATKGIIQRQGLSRTISTSNISNTSNTSTTFHNHVNINTNVNVNVNNKSYFSSMPSMKENDDTLTIPSNLKFDPRAISTPIYGLDKIGEEEEEVAVDESEDDNVVEANDVDVDVDIDVEEDDDEEDEDDIEEEDTTYSLSKLQPPKYAIPLPERLTAPILNFTSTTTTSSPPEEVGTINLSQTLFGQSPIRTDILHRCITYQRNKKRGRRNNGARTKTISTISGSGAKVRNQKGGGIARAGHKRPPHWRGGAKAHGPKGNDTNYETKLNKKVRMLGVKMALSQKLLEGNLILVNDFSLLGSYKTKVLAEALDFIGDIGGRYGCTAFVVDHVSDGHEEEDHDDDSEEATLKSIKGVDINLHVASGNLHKIKVRNQKFVNVYDIMKHEKIVLSLSALEALEERYA